MAEHGSQDTSRLSRTDSAWCERHVNHGTGFRSMDLSRCKEHALTYVRALRGFRVTTLALAAPVMTAVMHAVSHGGREEQAGGVIGVAQAGYHHGS